MRRCGAPIDLPRNTSVVKFRCHGLIATGAISCAHSQIFYGCRKHAYGSSADRRLVFAGTSAGLSWSAGDYRPGNYSDQIWPQMAGKDCLGYQSYIIGLGRHWKNVFSICHNWLFTWIVNSNCSWSFVHAWFIHSIISGVVLEMKFYLEKLI